MEAGRSYQLWRFPSHLPPPAVVTHLLAHPGHTLSLRVDCGHMVARVLYTYTLCRSCSPPSWCMLAPSHVISTRTTPPSERAYSEHCFIAFIPP